MGGLDQAANVVRAVRLGALALILTFAIGGSWVTLQHGVGHGVAQAQSAGTNHQSAQVRTMPYLVIVGANNKVGNPICYFPATPSPANDRNATTQHWQAVPCPKP